MRSGYWLTGLLLLTGVSQGQAETLPIQLQQYFSTRYAQSGGDTHSLKIKIKTPQNLWPLCTQPVFSLPGNSRMWGLLSVAASCDNNRRYLQVEVQVSGSYVVATRQIARGSTISAADLRMENGRLDLLPARTLFDSHQVMNAIALRDIIPDQPVTEMMMRQPWLVKSGQPVTVVTSGPGFSVRSEGRAMNNAAVAQTARVRMGSGQIVSGKVSAEGNILISL